MGRYLTLLISIFFLTGCKGTEDILASIDQDGERGIIVSGQCQGHEIVGTWVGSVEGSTDTLQINDDCTYTRTHCSEIGTFPDSIMDDEMSESEGPRGYVQFITGGYNVETTLNSKPGCPLFNGTQSHSGTFYYQDSEDPDDDEIDLIVRDGFLGPGQVHKTYTFSRQ